MKGQDYPIGYVRWTENRNMEAILDLISMKKLDVLALVSHRFEIADALGAYDVITGKKLEKYLGILIQYPEKNGQAYQKTSILQISQKGKQADAVTIGFIGAGNFAQSNLIPPLQKLPVHLKGVVTSKPVNARSVAEKFNFDFCSTDQQQILEDEDINAVFIASRHDSHARYVMQALENGKHVFVEKPLAVTSDELAAIRDVYRQNAEEQNVILFTGFNRRFSSPFLEMKKFFDGRVEPLVMQYRVNAGYLPKTHWTLAPEQGGRIVGEGCHFLDCFSFMTEARPVRVFAESINTENNSIENADNVSITVRYADGSIGTLLYIASGSPALSKEYYEVHCEGRSALMHNFEEVTFFNQQQLRKRKFNGSKGHREEIAHFINIITGKERTGLSVESIFDTTAASLCAVESLRTGQAIAL